MKINTIVDKQNEDRSQALNHHRTYIEVDNGFLGKEIVPVDFPKDRSHHTYDPVRYARRHRLSARIFGIVNEAALWVTGTTFVTSVFGRFLLEKALQDWRVAVFLLFILIVFPVFLCLYLASKDADIRWAVGLKFLSITLGAIIGGSHA